jgi:hypothetical protein
MTASTHDELGLSVLELAERLNAMCAAGQGDQPAVIAFDPGYTIMGGRPTVAITDASAGFDWDQGKVFLHTAKRLGPAGESLAKLHVQLDMLSAARYRAQRVLENPALLDTERVARLRELFGAGAVPPPSRT